MGTGLVGSAITELLLDANIRVTVWHRTQSKTKPLHYGDYSPRYGGAELCLIGSSSFAYGEYWSYIDHRFIDSSDNIHLVVNQPVKQSEPILPSKSKGYRISSVGAICSF